MRKGFANDRYRALMEQLVAARKLKGWSQATLAAELKHHQQFVSRYELGERVLDPVEYADIADMLGVDWATALKSR